MNGCRQDDSPIETTVELPCVYIIDENAAGRGRLIERITSTRYSLQELVSPLRLMDALSPEPACIVMVQRAPGDGYADLLRERRRLEWTAEVIVLATNATVELAVQAMHMGAFHVFDLVTVSNDALKATIQAAIAASELKRRRLIRHHEFARSMANLSTREREVLELVVAGKPNKQIAKHLGISIRTVEDRRRNIYHKLGVDSAVQLVTLVLENNPMRHEDSWVRDQRRTIAG